METADNNRNPYFPASDTSTVTTPPKPKRWKPTGYHVGRPSKAEVATRAAEIKRSRHDQREYQRALRRLERAERSKNWGGKRAGAGRPRLNRDSDGKVTMAFSARIDRELAEKINRLPRGQVSAYIRAAVDLMKDLAPPDKFLASGEKIVALGEEKMETDPVVY
jgi:hypothetical protein